VSVKVLPTSKAMSDLSAIAAHVKKYNDAAIGKLAAIEAAHESLQEQLKTLRGTTRSPTRRMPAADSGPPVRRAARKAAVGKTSRAKART
jgi:hypothetical protein